MKKFFVFAAALLVSVAAFAQETNKDENGKTIWGPYETNSFFDNTFINLGGGVNTAVKSLTNPKTWGNFGIAAQADFGKWFTPDWGARIGYRGIANDIKDFANVANKFHFGKADLLWNLSNAVAGYKELRVWDIIPFAGAGVLATNQGSGMNLEYGAEGGFINNFRLGNRVDLNLELGTIVGRGAAYNVGAGRVILFPYATLGLGFNLGKTNWTRKATTVAAYTAAVAAAEAAANAAKANVDAALAAKNAAEASAKSLADENAKLRKELEDALGQAGDYSALFDEPIYAFFKIGSAKLSNAEKKHIEYAVKNIISRGDKVKLNIFGDADKGTGSKRTNEKLSQKRADAVYKLLTGELGLDPSRFEVVKGKFDGVDDLTPAELNRCVVITK